MTSTTGEAGHPDVDELSAFAEGLLSSVQRTQLRGHLNGCAECSDTYTSLEEIRGLLGSFPDPTPMPADVVERIDTALAAEALSMASTASPSPAGHVSRETLSGAGAPSSAGTPATRGNRPAGRPGAATGPGRTTRFRLGGRRRVVTLGAAFTVAVLGLATLLLQTLGSDLMGGTPGGPGGHTVASDSTFSSENLESQVTTLLKDHPQPLVSPKRSLDIGHDNHNTHNGQDGGGGPGTPSTTATPLQTAVTVPDCIRRGIGRSDSPIAAKRGVFDGAEAYLVVLPHATDQSKVSAYVVDAACIKEHVPPPGSVLLTRSLSRH